MATPTLDSIRWKFTAAADAAVFDDPHRMMALAKWERRLSPPSEPEPWIPLAQRSMSDADHARLKANGDAIRRELQRLADPLKGLDEEMAIPVTAPEETARTMPPHGRRPTDKERDQMHRSWLPLYKRLAQGPDD